MKRLRPTGLMLLGMLALPLLSPADDDTERETSVYDKHPECTERTEGGPRPDKCIVQNGPPNHQGIATRGAQPADSDQPNSAPNSPTTSGRTKGTTFAPTQGN